MSHRLHQVLGQRNVAAGQVIALTPSRLLAIDDDSEASQKLKNAEGNLRYFILGRKVGVGRSYASQQNMRMVLEAALSAHPIMKGEAGMHLDPAVIVQQWSEALFKLNACQRELLITPVGNTYRSTFSKPHGVEGTTKDAPRRPLPGDGAERQR